MSNAQPLLVVGLGNPGKQYESTRHNIGRDVVTLLAHRAGATMSSNKKTSTTLTTARLGGHSIILASPTTYMNESGRAVAALMRFYSVSINSASCQLIVVHDELDIDFGTVRLKMGGGEGGHNGLRSITQSIGTKDYLRVRVGIGRPPGRMDVSSFVLSKFAAPEREDVGVLVERAADAVEDLIIDGLSAAQNKVHSLK